MPSDTKAAGTTENLRSFNAYADENGQHDPDAPNDVARPSELQRILASDPGGEAETARIASGKRDEDGTAATEAEVPPGTIEKLGDASLDMSAPANDAAGEAIDRATSGLGRK